MLNQQRTPLFWPSGSIVFALLTFSIGFANPPPPALPLADVPVDFVLVILLIATVIGIPFSYWLPIAWVGLFRDMWRMPSGTYLLSRPLICLMGTSLLGGSLGGVALGLAVDLQYALMPGMQLIFTIVFLVSASRRYRKPPSAEFAMPLFPKFFYRF